MNAIFLSNYNDLCVYKVEIDDLYLTLPQPIVFNDSNRLNTKQEKYYLVSNRIYPYMPNNRNIEKHVPFRAAKLISLTLFIIFVIASVILIPSLMFGLKRSINNDLKDQDTIRTIEPFQCYSSSFNSVLNTSSISNCTNTNSCLLSHSYNGSDYYMGMCNDYNVDFNAVSITLSKVIHVNYCEQTLCNNQNTLLNLLNTRDICINKTLIYPIPSLNNSISVSQCYTCSFCFLKDESKSSTIQNCNTNTINFCEVIFYLKKI